MRGNATLAMVESSACIMVALALICEHECSVDVLEGIPLQRLKVALKRDLIAATQRARSSKKSFLQISVVKFPTSTQSAW
jgi:hypothetical protein